MASAAPFGSNWPARHPVPYRAILTNTNLCALSPPPSTFLAALSQFDPQNLRDTICSSINPSARSALHLSRKGNCYDNAVVESFFSSLKNELIHHRNYHTRDEARTEIFEYIELFYNRESDSPVARV